MAATKPDVLTAIDRIFSLALAGGTFSERPSSRSERDDDSFEGKERRFSATYGGFDVHCAVRIPAGDDEGREPRV